MKNLIFLSFYLFIFLSCKRTIKTVESKSSNSALNNIYLPNYSITNADYKLESKINANLKRKLSSIRLNLKRFTEANLDDDLDIHGTPDYAYENLYIYAFPDPAKREIYFNAKRIKKEYTFYYEKNKLICVLEGIYDNDAIFIGDSLFFSNKKIFLWKNTSNKYVTDSVYLNGKSQYIMRLDTEIKEIIDLGFTQYIDNYVYKDDSASNFVIGNLK